MPPRILVVDRNEAFATMLEDMLVAEGGYEVQVAHAGSDALAHLRRSDFDLTIVDMDLDPEDMDSRQLIQNVRQARPQMRLVLIPIMGEDLAPDMRQLDIQGALSKPFFADDLLPRIKESLARQVGSPALRQPPTPVPRAIAPRPAAKPSADVQSVLSELARETNADAILLLSTADGGWKVIAHVTNLSDSRVETLASLSAAAVEAGRSIARFWGQLDAPFEHNMFESTSLRLYIMALPENLLLMIATPVSTQLGTIRYNLRRAARSLAARR